MLTPNRRNTEAAEKTARAEQRIAASKERLVHHVADFLDACDDMVEGSDAARPATPPPPAKNQPPRK